MKHSREFCYAEIQNSCPLVWAQAQQGVQLSRDTAIIEVLLRGSTAAAAVKPFQELPSTPLWRPFS